MSAPTPPLTMPRVVHSWELGSEVLVTVLWQSEGFREYNMGVSNTIFIFVITFKSLHYYFYIHLKKCSLNCFTCTWIIYTLKFWSLYTFFIVLTILFPSDCYNSKHEWYKIRFYTHIAFVQFKHWSQRALCWWGAQIIDYKGVLFNISLINMHFLLIK